MDDALFQRSINQWLSQLSADPRLGEVIQEVTALQAHELPPFLAALAEENKAIFSWWLEWSMRLPPPSRPAEFENNIFLQAHLLCWPEDRGSSWWLVALTLLAAVIGVLVAYWMRIGPRPVDPAAETLERVDPIDLDTQAVTISNPGLETDF